MCKGSKRAALSLSELSQQGARTHCYTDFYLDRVFADQFSSGLLDQKFRTMLFSTFGVAALLLCRSRSLRCRSYDVATRRFEMGLRISLGADTWQTSVVSDPRGAYSCDCGDLGRFLIVTYWGAKFLQSFLYQVDARNPLTYVLVALGAIATAIMAAWLPARRAARTDPATVLRAE